MTISADRAARAGGFRLWCVIFDLVNKSSENKRTEVSCNEGIHSFGPRRLCHYVRLPPANHLRQDRLPIAPNAEVNKYKRKKSHKEGAPERKRNGLFATFLLSTEFFFIVPLFRARKLETVHI